MITGRYLTVEKLSALLWGITSNHVGDFYCFNCFHSFRTENKLKKPEYVSKNNDYCYIEVPKEDNKVSKYNHGQKCMKHPFIIYADLECLLQKKWAFVIIILKDHQHLKNMNIQLLFIQYLHIVHLMLQNWS